MQTKTAIMQPLAAIALLAMVGLSAVPASAPVNAQGEQSAAQKVNERLEATLKNYEEQKQQSKNELALFDEDQRRQLIAMQLSNAVRDTAPPDEPAIPKDQGASLAARWMPNWSGAQASFAPAAQQGAASSADEETAFNALINDNANQAYADYLRAERDRQRKLSEQSASSAPAIIDIPAQPTPSPDAGVPLPLAEIPQPDASATSHAASPAQPSQPVVTTAVPAAPLAQAQTPPPVVTVPVPEQPTVQQTTDTPELVVPAEPAVQSPDAQQRPAPGINVSGPGVPTGVGENLDTGSIPWYRRLFRFFGIKI
jgi:hypothetical protein